MLKNLAPNLSSLPTPAGFIAIVLWGSLVLSGCSSHNDDNNGCCFPSPLLLQPHQLSGANAGDQNESTDGGANPSIALSLPGVGEIPGTEDIPLDLGVLPGLNDSSLVDALRAISDGDARALLNVLGGGPVIPDLKENLRDFFAQ